MSRTPRRVGKILGTTLLLACMSGCVKDEPRPKEVRTERDAPEVQSVPLGAVYSTSGQKGLNLLSIADGGHGQYLARLSRELRGGDSQVTIVRACDLEAAVGLGMRALLFATNRPETGDDPQEPIWVVAYLGTAGSDPPAWLVRSVERKGTTIRVAYQNGQAKSKDRRQYLIWACLGRLKPAEYTLELFDMDKGEVVFMRRYGLPPPKPTDPLGPRPREKD